MISSITGSADSKQSRCCAHDSGDLLHYFRSTLAGPSTQNRSVLLVLHFTNLLRLSSHYFSAHAVVRDSWQSRWYCLESRVLTVLQLLLLRLLLLLILQLNDQLPSESVIPNFLVLITVMIVQIVSLNYWQVVVRMNQVVRMIVGLQRGCMQLSALRLGDFGKVVKLKHAFRFTHKEKYLLLTQFNVAPPTLTSFLLILSMRFVNIFSVAG